MYFVHNLGLVVHRSPAGVHSREARHPQVVDRFVHSERKVVTAMRCPYCRHADSRVVDSREQDEGQAIRRRRSCQGCGRRFTTVEEATLAVIKRSGVTEPFSRDKVVSGVRRACQGRPVDEDALAQLAQAVEETIRANGVAEVNSDEVGLAILGPLRALDEVAYLRFASVYQAFSSVEDFEKAISELRDEHRPNGP